MEHATMCHLTYKTCSHKAHEELRSLKQTMRWKKLLSMIKQSVILPLAGNILCMVFKIQKKGCDIATRGAAPERWLYSLRVRGPHFASKVSYNAGAAEFVTKFRRQVANLMRDIAP